MAFDAKKSALKPGEEPWIAKEDPSEALKELRQPGQVDPRGHQTADDRGPEAGGGTVSIPVENLFHFLRGIS